MEGGSTPITDPASVLIGLGALCAIFAAARWAKVARSIDTSGQVLKGPDLRALGEAAAVTALALGLAAVGYLLGRFTGQF